MLHAIDPCALALVVGGVDLPAPPTTGQQIASYATACVTGAASGALYGAAAGAITGAGALPGAGLGAVGGCVRSMVWMSTPAY